MQVVGKGVGRQKLGGLGRKIRLGINAASWLCMSNVLGIL